VNTTDSMITPFARDYATCLECYAELLIYPGEVHPDVITFLLGISATQINIAGTSFTNSKGKSREIKISGWFLSSKDKVNSKDLRDHIDWVMMQLSRSRDALHEIQNTRSVKMTLKCTWRSKDGHSGPVLWPQQMTAISALGLECSFDIYFDDQ